jgi:hypothetical protein
MEKRNFVRSMLKNLNKKNPKWSIKLLHAKLIRPLKEYRIKFQRNMVVNYSEFKELTLQLNF